MKHFWRKPGKTLITVTALFMAVGLFGSPVYAQTNVVNNPDGGSNQGTDTQAGDSESGNIMAKLQDDAPDDLKEHKDDLVVDVYKIADANKDPHYDTYTYTVRNGFNIPGYDLSKHSGTEPNTEYLSTMNREKWESFTQEVTKLVRDHDDIRSDESGSIDQWVTDVNPGLETGLYLVLAHDKDVTSKKEYFEDQIIDEGNATEPVTAPKKMTVTTFNTETNKYYFRPVLVSVPSTNIDTTTDMNTADGTWVFDVNVYLKPSFESRFGKLTINKQVQVLEDRLNDQKITPMTAVFRITGWSDDKKTNKVYSNVASITVPDGKPVTLDRLPVGAYVEVEEIYTGAGYKLVDSSPASVIIPSPDDKEAAEVSFTFTNTYNDELKKGYGVMNSFTKTENSWAWKNDLNGSSSAAEGGTE